jgi:hypothetical protein
VYHVKAFVSLVIQSLQQGIAQNDAACLECRIRKKRPIAKEELSADFEEKERSEEEEKSATTKKPGKQWHQKKKWRGNAKKTNSNSSNGSSIIDGDAMMENSLIDILDTNENSVTTTSTSTSESKSAMTTTETNAGNQPNEMSSSSVSIACEEGFYIKESIFVDLNVYNHLASLRMFGCTKKADFRPLVLDEKYSLPRQIASTTGMI